MTDRFKDNLWSDLVREHGPALAQAERPAQTRSRLRRPRVMAGGTLGLAGIATALVLALGGSQAAPAFAVTRNDDGSVLVTLGGEGADAANLVALNDKLESMGLHEVVTIYMGAGPAAVPGAVSCEQGSGAATPVEILVGDDGTQTVAPGDEPGVEGAGGSFHLGHCVVTGPGQTGEARYLALPDATTPEAAVAPKPAR